MGRITIAASVREGSELHDDWEEFSDRYDSDSEAARTALRAGIEKLESERSETPGGGWNLLTRILPGLERQTGNAAAATGLAGLLTLILWALGLPYVAVGSAVTAAAFALTGLLSLSWLLAWLTFREALTATERAESDGETTGGAADV